MMWKHPRLCRATVKVTLTIELDFLAENGESGDYIDEAMDCVTMQIHRLARQVDGVHRCDAEAECTGPIDESED